MKQTPSRAMSEARHIGIMMDGNGRWAAQRHQPRVAGHRAGVKAVRRVTEAAARIGLEQLTLFAFSSENWARPKAEVSALMRLFKKYLRSERSRLLKNDIRLVAIGRLNELPREVLSELNRSVQMTSNGQRLTLCLAINYGARNELVDACRRLAGDAIAGRISVAGIDEAALSAQLYQPDMPSLDLIIRTGGEMRLSNFMLWQAAYAELLVTPTCWPDFTEKHLAAALATYRKRERKFGGITSVAHQV